ncbi:glycoside hydrolase family 9 protein [Kribbella sp. NPDC049174]|uniref:glycoside hydrolase family 9 protein n=1 Tax=Kribbella sp. NPDC049174 TaxID=3364112 RepID=UPI003715E92F
MDRTPASRIPLPNATSRAAPAKCYLDEIGSYSTNEVAVNWNSALAWLTAYAAA